MALPWPLVITLGILFAGGFLAINQSGRNKDLELRNDLKRQVEAIARTINPEMVKTLHFSISDTNSPDFQRISLQMSTYEKTIKQVFQTTYLTIYSMVKRDNQIIFGPESIDKNGLDASPPGTIYLQPSKSLVDIFENGRAVIEGPTRDEYGTFISALAPVFDPASGEVLMVIGMDIELSAYQAAVSYPRFISFLCVLVLVIVLIGGTILLTLRHKLPDNFHLLKKHADALIVATFGAALTMIIALALQQNQTADQKDIFTQVSEPEAKSVYKAFRNLRDYQLGGLTRYFSGPHQVSREEFRSILAPMFRMSGRQIMIGWIAPITAVEKEALEVKAKSEGIANFRVWQKDSGDVNIQASHIPDAYPFWYLEPQAGNEELLGYDLASESACMEAITKAGKTGLPTATVPVILTNNVNEYGKILVFHPVFSDEPVNQKIRGFLVAVVNPGLFMQKAVFHERCEDLQTIIDLYQLTGSTPPLHIASSFEASEPYLSSEGNDGISQPWQTHAEIYPVFIFDKTYLVVVYPAPGSYAANPGFIGWLSILVGFLLTVLCTIFTVFLNRRKAYLELLVASRTADLLKREAELVKLNAETNKFFSIIAHDLRSPFNGFLGYTQMMVEDLPDLTPDEIHKIALIMRNSATNLFRLLENLLDWSRIQQGLIAFNPEMHQLYPIVEESIDMAVEQAKNKGIQICFNVPEDLEVFADSNILQTIIRNLVSNAVKFTPRGGQIDIAAKPADDETVEISIKDSGIGMSRNMIDNLFRIDIQTNRKGTEGEPGTGLGLMLCKDFVEKHSGKLWVESTEDIGSVFYFTIPCNPQKKEK